MATTSNKFVGNDVFSGKKRRHPIITIMNIQEMLSAIYIQITRISRVDNFTETTSRRKDVRSRWTI